MCLNRRGHEVPGVATLSRCGHPEHIDSQCGPARLGIYLYDLKRQLLGIVGLVLSQLEPRLFEAMAQPSGLEVCRPKPCLAARIDVIAELERGGSQVFDSA